MMLALLALIGMLPGAVDTVETGSIPTHQGLYFAYSIGPHLSSPTSFVNGGYVWTASIGYVVSPALSLGVQIQTGDDDIPGGSTRPTGGRLAIGGAAIEATYFLLTGGRAHPFVTAGAGLLTVLQKPGHGSGGYNGSGGMVQMGVQYDLWNNLAIAGALSSRWSRFSTLVSVDDPAGQFEPFQDHQLGFSGRIVFYPGISP